MTDQNFVEAYAEKLRDEREKYEDEKAKVERRLALIDRKLANPARAFNQELKAGSLRVQKIMGVPVPPRKSNLPGRRPAADPVPAPVVERQPKKSFWEKLTSEDDE